MHIYGVYTNSGENNGCTVLHCAYLEKNIINTHCMDNIIILPKDEILIWIWKKRCAYFNNINTLHFVKLYNISLLSDYQAYDYPIFIKEAIYSLMD